MRPITSKSSSGAADWQLDAAMAADITLDALFRRAFRVFADRTAVTWEGGQRRYREVGERAWRVLLALLPGTPKDQLMAWADRFNAEPSRRLIILKWLADKQLKDKEEEPLAYTRQNIGEAEQNGQITHSGAMVNGAVNTAAGFHRGAKGEQRCPGCFSARTTAISTLPAVPPWPPVTSSPKALSEA